ncbi:hypothetical protein DVS77_10600 [Mycolicibacterium moriokaense]|nr:hypothetical protein DVS77_10600 [Mycolicibacterium moriokaense]
MAFVGVGAIAIAPIAATPPDVKIANADIELSASPLQQYLEALQRAIDNAQLILEELFAEPTPISEEWMLNSLVVSLLDDLDPDVGWLTGPLGVSPTALGAQLGALAEAPPGRLATVADPAVPGNIQAVEQLATEAIAAVLLHPLAAVDAGASAGVAVAHEVLDALNSRDPRRVLNAIVTAPKVIVDGIVHGYAQFPGLLDTRDPAIGAMPAAQRLVTVDVPAATGARRNAPSVTGLDTRDTDDGTNADVMADRADADRFDANRRRPPLFGSNSTGASDGSLAPNLLSGGVREGIRSGLRGFGKEVRSVVKTVTGRGDGHDDSPTGGPDDTA